MYAPSATPAKRLYYLDVIKVLCLTFVFLFHCFKVFDADRWYIKNITTLNIKAGYVYELGLAVMPGFFFISGASIWLSMQKRSGLVFVQNIFKRFFFPLLFGLTVLAIPQLYFQKISTNEFQGSIIQFLPYYFEQLKTATGFFWAVHLWFLVLLFIFSLTMVPFFVMGKKWLQHPAAEKIIHHPLFYLLLIFLVMAPGWKLHPNAPLGTLWVGWNLFQNLIFLVSGFVLFSTSRFLQLSKQYKWQNLAIAILLTGLSMYWYEDIKQTGFRTPVFNVKLLVKTIACWAWISSVLGITATYFSGETRFIKYWTVAAMPFYILSQPVIIAIAYFVVQWPLPIFLKFCVITGASFGATIVLYEGIKRNKLLRWFFGVPPKKSVRFFKAKMKSNRIVKGQLSQTFITKIFK